MGLRLAGLSGTSTRVEIDLAHATDLKQLLGTELTPSRSRAR